MYGIMNHSKRWYISDLKDKFSSSKRKIIKNKTESNFMFKNLKSHLKSKAFSRMVLNRKIKATLYRNLRFSTIPHFHLKVNSLQLSRFN